MSPEVIRDTDTVQLRCHTSQSTSVSQCYFYIEERQHLQQTTSCQQSLTGTKLLEWAGRGPTTKVNMRCIYYAVEMSIYSPYSDPVSVTLLGKRGSLCIIIPCVFLFWSKINTPDYCILFI